MCFHVFPTALATFLLQATMHQCYGSNYVDSKMKTRFVYTYILDIKSSSQGKDFKI